MTAVGARPLNRTAPFLAHDKAGENIVILLDRFEVGLEDYHGNPDVIKSVAASLDLTGLGPFLSCDSLIDLLDEQFAAAAEFVYGHPFWARVRSGSQRAIYAYLLETRHYLAAAASRMAPSVHPGIGLAPLTLLLSRHLLEEWEHQCFFGDALAAVGCSPAHFRSARPAPATLEWIHATRFIALKSGLSAAACSGFMEVSSTDTEAVRGWHAMLRSSGLIPPEAEAAMFRHFEVDVGFDHAQNWQRAVRAAGPVASAHAAEILNDVCTIAESIYRWLSALDRGLAGSIVHAMQVLVDAADAEAAEPHPLEVKIFDGLPVWPASLLDAANWGIADATPAAEIVVAATFGLGHVIEEGASRAQGFASLVASHRDRLVDGNAGIDLSSSASIARAAARWLRSIDGHALWDALLDEPPDSLITGYMLENFHYLASAARHIAPAISSCDHPEVRKAFLAHLEDELEHCDILRDELRRVGGIEAPEHMRPLPTTTAFVGYLQVLAASDWQAYTLVSTYLQSSLSETRSSGRHKKFYDSLIASRSPVSGLIQAMAVHDAIDDGLNHDSRHLTRLDAIVADGSLAHRSVARAAVAPALAWSFLDGILQHYRCGNGAIAQRAGWRG